MSVFGTFNQDPEATHLKKNVDSYKRHYKLGKYSHGHGLGPAPSADRVKRFGIDMTSVREKYNRGALTEEDVKYALRKGLLNINNLTPADAQHARAQGWRIFGHGEQTIPETNEGAFSLGPAPSLGSQNYYYASWLGGDDMPMKKFPLHRYS